MVLYYCLKEYGRGLCPFAVSRDGATKCSEHKIECPLGAVSIEEAGRADYHYPSAFEWKKVYKSYSKAECGMYTLETIVHESYVFAVIRLSNSFLFQKSFPYEGGISEQKKAEWKARDWCEGQLFKIGRDLVSFCKEADLRNAE